MGALTPCPPQHCLLGWDILPPKSEKSSAPKSLDLWSCVTSEAQHRKQSADLSHTVWSGLPWEGQMPWSRPGDCRVLGAELGCLPTGAHLLALTQATLPGSTSHQLSHPTQEGDPNSKIQKGMRLELG